MPDLTMILIRTFFLPVTVNHSRDGLCHILYL